MASILVVEDESAMNDLIRAELEAEGHVVRQALDGHSLVFFPEGTFTADSGIRPFQLGAFKAAVAAGVPIIPVSLAGTRRFLREGTYLPRPTRVTITLSRPIYPHMASTRASGSESSDWHELIRLRDQTREAIARHVDEPVL